VLPQAVPSDFGFTFWATINCSIMIGGYNSNAKYQFMVKHNETSPDLTDIFFTDNMINVNLVILFVVIIVMPSLSIFM